MSKVGPPPFYDNPDYTPEWKWIINERFTAKLEQMRQDEQRRINANIDQAYDLAYSKLGIPNSIPPSNEYYDQVDSAIEAAIRQLLE